MLAQRQISRRLHNGVRIVNRPDPENCMRLDCSIMPLVSSMESTGIRIDRSGVGLLHDRLTTEMSSLAAKLTQQTGYTININSGDQLADLLFVKLKMKQVGSRERWTKSKKRLATDSDVLKAMISHEKHGATIKTILDWKEREKLRSTYTYSLLARADEQDTLHTDFSLTTASTWRLASSDPNLQNIPIRTDLGIEIRKLFVPRPSMVFGSTDASQIEMRLNAHDSECERMLEVFWDKEDIYWDNAELIYRRQFSKHDRTDGLVEDPSAPDNMQGLPNKKWYRQCAKVFALMVGYDASPGAVMDQFLSWGIPGWDERSCADGLVDYFHGYPELLDARKRHHRRGIRYGFVWDMWGHWRWIPQFKSCHRRIVGEGQRQACNVPGQGGAAGAIKLWMAMIWDLLLYGTKQWHRHVKVLLQVHDELVSEGPRAAVEDFQQECLHLMRNMLPYDTFVCPLDGSAVTGETSQSWGMLPH